jgi:multicomponent K+:H+ antiporter subunit E
MPRRLVPHPRLTILLTVVWLMLLNGVSVGGVVLGLALGVAIPLMTSAYWPDRPVVRNAGKFWRYLLIVLWDIVTANIAVARIILTRPNHTLRPAFFAVPLELRAPEAITLLAGTITMTPGTVSCDLSADGRSLLVHVLDTPDPEAVRDEIKSRYEARLMEIFP